MRPLRWALLKLLGTPLRTSISLIYYYYNFKMSDLVFLGDENYSVVDDWMNESKSAVQNTPSSDASKFQDAKSGLGFKGDIKKPAKVDDKFIQAMDKNKKNKGKRQREEEKGEYEATHGVVEDFEESRTAFTGGFVKKSVIKAVIKAKKVAAEPTPIDKSQISDAGAVSENGNNNETSKTDKKLNAFNSYVEGENFKAKRTKTRSKQKNIRRDNRGADVKPAHLQVGNKEYTGRPLTQETKKLLNIVKPPPKTNNNRNNNNNNNNSSKGGKTNTPNKSSNGNNNDNSKSNKPEPTQSTAQPTAADANGKNGSNNSSKSNKKSKTN